MKQGLLADMIVSRQLFAFWLPDMCDSGSPSQALYDRITSTAWQKGHLLTVLGYFSSQEVLDMTSATLIDAVGSFCLAFKYKWMSIPCACIS